jgi:hypothetical protein
MTLLIFKTAERVFATTAWTAEAWTEPSGESFVKITFLGEHEPGSPQQRVYFAISMADFLAKKVGDTIDLLEWRRD